MERQGNGCINLVVHKRLHWNVTVFLGGQGVALGSELGQTAADAETGVARLNHIIDVAILSCLIRIGEELVVLVLLLGDEGLHVLTSFLLGLSLLGIQHSSSTRGTHHGDLSRGPCVVQVGVELLRAHHDVRTTVGLTQGDGDLGYGSLAISVEPDFVDASP